MTAYAVAQVHAVTPGPEILEYLRRIDETLDPFGGRFLVHGGDRLDTVEGSWGALGLILIEFPDHDSALAWWNSPAYREIAPLRTRHMRADIVLAQGVPDGYRAADHLAKL
ncbi:DUF1330 domain-containing protein [Kitasatospora sp. NPDC094028]